MWKSATLASIALAYAFLAAEAGKAQNTPVAEDEHVLTDRDLIATAEQIRSFRSRDPFVSVPAINLVGRRFQVDMPVRMAEAKGCTSLPFWRYLPEKRRLELTFFGDNRSGYSIKGRDGKVHAPLSDAGSFETVPVQCREVDLGSYRASNAFGVSTTIYKKRQTVVEIGLVRLSRSSSDGYLLWSSLEMEPEIARAAVGKIRLRYSGYLTEWGTGSSLACGIEHSQPDMRSFSDQTTDTCIYRGVVEQVAFVDAVSGKVQAERMFTSEPAQ